MHTTRFHIAVRGFTTGKACFTAPARGNRGPRFLLLVLLALPGCFARAQDPRPAPAPVPVTLDTIVDTDIRNALAVPQTFWCSDGSLLLLDSRPAAAQRKLERMTISAGRRAPACDGEKALSSLKLLEGTSGLPETWTWPENFSQDGRLAVYNWGGDLYLLDLTNSVFTRLTKTPGAEKNPLFSPDGKKLSYVLNNNLRLADLESGSDRPLTTDGSETVLNGTLSWVYWEEIMGRRDTAAWWSPDSQALAFLQSDESKVELSVQPSFEPPTPKLIWQRYAKAGTPNPKVRAGVYLLKEQRIQWIDPGQPVPEYTLRLDWTPDSRQLAVQTAPRSQKSLHLHLADPQTGKCNLVLKEDSATFINPHNDLRFVNSGNQIIWPSERSGQYRYYLYNLDGTLVRPVETGNLVIRPSSGVAWVKGGIVGIDDRSLAMYFTATQGSPIAPGLFRVSWMGGPVEPLTRRPGTHRISMDPKCQYYLDEYSRASEPPGLWIFLTAGSPPMTLAQPGTARLKPFDLQAPHFLKIPAADNFPLPARLYRPANLAEGRKVPLIVHVYGGPSAPLVQDAWNRDALFINLLLSRGFAYIDIDNRSATGLSKTLEDSVYGKFMAGGEVEDIVAAVRWLKAKPWVDPDRVGVWGWSGGGTLTLQLLTRSKEFRAGISGAPVTDFRYYDTVISECYMGMPQDVPDQYRASAPANFAKDLSGRLLLIHGALDDNVHLQNSWRMVDELQKAGITFDLMIYPQDKHSVTSPAGRRHLHQTMLEFWERNLPGK